MPRVYLLGTGSAVTDSSRTTTMLAFSDQSSTFVVDCGGDAMQRLLSVGIRPEEVSALVITHTHPDHISGFPLFMEKLWLHGRRERLPVYGISDVIDLARHLWEAFDMAGWKDFPEIEWNVISDAPNARVFMNESWEVIASPGKHNIPVIGLRIVCRQSGRSVAYSCDTEPCPAIQALATGTAILFHEANGDGPGHSSALQAAEIATSASAQQLVLVHLPPQIDVQEMDAARAIFANTQLGRELGEYPI